MSDSTQVNDPPGLPERGLDPGLAAELRAEAITALRAYIKHLGQEKARAETALNALAYAPHRTRPNARPNGTYTVIRAYLKHVRDTRGPGQEITAGPAAEWMLANGWVTNTQSHTHAVSHALNYLSKWGELRRVRHGVYQEPPPAERGEG